MAFSFVREVRVWPILRISSDGQANRSGSDIVDSTERNLVIGSMIKLKNTAVVSCTDGFASRLQRNAPLNSSRSTEQRQHQTKQQEKDTGKVKSRIVPCCSVFFWPDFLQQEQSGTSVDQSGVSAHGKEQVSK